MQRRAERRRCPDCRRWTWTGPDDEICAVEIVTDDQPLDGYGEALALLDGRRTVELRAGVFRPRAPWSRRRRAPGQPYVQRSQLQLVTVLPEHRCGRPMPAAEPSPWWATQPLTAVISQASALTEPPY